jgi:hypothetical protein
MIARISPGQASGHAWGKKTGGSAISCEWQSGNRAKSPGFLSSVQFSIPWEAPWKTGNSQVRSGANLLKMGEQDHGISPSGRFACPTATSRAVPRLRSPPSCEHSGRSTTREERLEGTLPCPVTASRNAFSRSGLLRREDGLARGTVLPLERYYPCENGRLRFQNEVISTQSL